MPIVTSHRGVQKRTGTFARMTDHCLEITLSESIGTKNNSSKNHYVCLAIIYWSGAPQNKRRHSKRQGFKRNSEPTNQIKNSEVRRVSCCSACWRLLFVRFQKLRLPRAAARPECSKTGRGTLSPAPQFQVTDNRAMKAAMTLGHLRKVPPARNMPTVRWPRPCIWTVRRCGEQLATVRPRQQRNG